MVSGLPEKIEENRLKWGLIAIRHINISRNKSLRTFETTAESIDHACDAAPGWLGAVLSSIASPTPLDVVVVYRDFYFKNSYNCALWDFHYHPSPADDFALLYRQQLRMFREAYDVRDFRLVLCVDVLDFLVEHAIRTLERTVEEGKGGLDYPPCKVIFERRIPRTRSTDYAIGSMSRNIPASAL